MQSQGFPDKDDRCARAHRRRSTEDLQGYPKELRRPAESRSIVCMIDRVCLHVPFNLCELLVSPYNLFHPNNTLQPEQFAYVRYTRIFNLGFAGLLRREKMGPGACNRRLNNLFLTQQPGTDKLSMPPTARILALQKVHPHMTLSR